MTRTHLLTLLLFLLSTTLLTTSCKQKVVTTEEYSGSESCFECHERFYDLWATSHHGLAMQPITQKFIDNEVIFNQEPIHMEGADYQAIVVDTTIVIRELKDGVTTDFPILWALGGKNVYYFLTPIDGGRLQTLPLAFNVNIDKWYNNPESAIRHFPSMQGHETTDEAISWKHHQYTFNTSCFSCHVSQLSNNYDMTNNTYETDWKEVGINCETCHGPAEQHIKNARLAEKKGEELTVENMGLIMTSLFTQEQHNASCAPCHAKMRAITPSYMPGDKYYDNYDLITLENPDFYPDGRDLGENYTMTTWEQNTCIRESDLHCVFCHTSSGRYRFDKPDFNEANKACTTCHTEKEEFYETHTHHKLNGPHPPKCIDCHMPMTTFGHMDRSDHSFRPPMPKATIEFESPNACNICHTDENAQWAQHALEKWGKDNGYQEETLDAGRLIVEARLNDWKNIDKILEAIKTDKYGEVYTASFLRLLANHIDLVKKDAALTALNHHSALVRSAAATTLYGFPNDTEIKKALLKAAKDELRLVRLSAAVSLSVYEPSSFTAEETNVVNAAMDEYTTSLVTRPDDWSAHYNLGNHYQNLGQYDKAIQSYETASNVYPEAVLPLVNSSFLHSISGDAIKAEEQLKKALQVEPKNEAANFNYGLLLAELKRMPEAEKALRTVLEVNDQNAAAAYNLSIIVSANNMNEAVDFSKMAAETQPNEPKYGYTYAFFLNQNNQTKDAIKTLNGLLKKQPEYISATFLLGQIYEQGGQKAKAIRIYNQAIEANANNVQAVQQLKANIERVK